MKYLYSLIFAFALFWGANASAYEFIFDSSSASSTNSLYYSDGWRYVGQYFEAVAVDNISSLAFHNTNDNSNLSFFFALCKGTPAPTSINDWIANAPTCNYAGNELIYSATIESEPAVDSWRKFLDFPDQALEFGEPYYIVLEVPNTVGKGIGYNPNIDNGMILTSPDPSNLGTMIFNVYSESEFGVEDIYTLDWTLGLSALPESENCCQNTECLVNGAYNSVAQEVNWQVHAGNCFEGYPPYQYLGNELASGTIPAYGERFTLSFETTLATTTEYCFSSLRNHTTGDARYHYYTYSDLAINVLATSTPICALNAPEMSFCATPCEGVATSSFGGDIECGLKKTIAWTVCPSDVSINAFKQAVDGAKTRFPFSLYTDVQKIIHEELTGSTTTTTITMWSGRTAEFNTSKVGYNWDNILYYVKMSFNILFTVCVMIIVLFIITPKKEE